MSDAAEGALANTLSLRALARSEDSYVRLAASSSLNLVADCAKHEGEAEDSDSIAVGPASPPTDLRFPAIQRWWLAGGLALTGVVGVLIIWEQWSAAAVVLVLRVAISAALGTEHSLPFEGHAASSTPLGVVSRCLAGHTGDALVLLAVAWCLVQAGRPVWGFAVVAASLVMVLATLYRVAALQVGLLRRRVAAERVARTTSVALGLVASAAWQPVVPMETLPLMALGALGAAGFAAYEFFATGWALRGWREWASVIAHCEDGSTHEILPDGRGLETAAGF